MNVKKINSILLISSYILGGLTISYAMEGHPLARSEKDIIQREVEECSLSTSEQAEEKNLSKWQTVEDGEKYFNTTVISWDGQLNSESFKKLYELFNDFKSFREDVKKGKISRLKPINTKRNRDRIRKRVDHRINTNHPEFSKLYWDKTLLLDQLKNILLINKSIACEQELSGFSGFNGTYSMYYTSYTQTYLEQFKKQAEVLDSNIEEDERVEYNLKELEPFKSFYNEATKNIETYKKWQEAKRSIFLKNLWKKLSTHINEYKDDYNEIEESIALGKWSKPLIFKMWKDFFKRDFDQEFEATLEELNTYKFYGDMGDELGKLIENAKIWQSKFKKDVENKYKFQIK